MALELVAIDPPQLAEQLRVAPQLLERARRTPRFLPDLARLRLANLVGIRPDLAPLERELRRRTLAAHRPSPKETRP